MSGISVHPNAMPKRHGNYNSFTTLSSVNNQNVEGFTNNVFTTLLTVPLTSNFERTTSVPGTSSGVTNVNAGTCPPPVADTPPASSSSASSPPAAQIPSTPFLSKLIEDEKKTIESLFRTAGQILPITTSVTIDDKAYDAAFQASRPAPIPTYGSTLQGFTFILFFWSYLSLTIVAAIYINQTTGNTANAVGTFTGAIVALVLIFALMKRFA
jgi:hypothetical protein